jgi:hypothetical protein
MHGVLSNTVIPSSIQCVFSLRGPNRNPNKASRAEAQPWRTFDSRVTASENIQRAHRSLRAEGWKGKLILWAYRL